ncbi:MAG: hypothetical protein QGD94_07500 [Planctomycetia bacterium]|nr:hypothetical protein [Planctomycetia bacterium]
MVGVLILFLTVIVLLVILIKPKWGVVLLWPMLFCYPHYYMAQRGLLPWNIGVDDLFICAFFLVIVLRRQLFGGIPFRTTYAFWGVLSFWFIWTVSNLSGLSMIGTYMWEPFVKNILKGVIFVLFTYCLLHSVDNTRDMRRLVLAFCFSAGLGAVLVILHPYYPATINMFTSGVAVETIEQYRHLVVARPSGAFMNANVAGGVLAVAGVVTICMLRMDFRPVTKLLLLLQVSIMFVAVLSTRSRAGILAMVMTLALMAIIGKHKRYAWLFLVAGGCVTLLVPGIREPLLERVEGIYDPLSGEWGGNVAARFRLWQAYLNSATAQVWLLGQGAVAGQMRMGLKTHSGYLSPFVIFGLGGVVWFVCFFLKMWKKAAAMSRHSDPTLAGIGSAVKVSMVALAAFAIAADPFTTSYTIYLMFLLSVLADRGSVLMAQEQATRQDVQKGALASGQTVCREGLIAT